MTDSGTGFVALYRWRVDPAKESSFIRAWSELTVLIREHQRGRGSRLHRASDGTLYGYAQWPDQATWEVPWDLPAEAQPIWTPFEMPSSSASRHYCSTRSVIYSSLTETHSSAATTSLDQPDSVWLVHRRRPVRAWLLGVLGTALVLVGVAGGFLAAQVPSVSALSITARVETTVRVTCESTSPVRISFDWTGSQQTQDYYDAPCDHTYRAGDMIGVFIASDDPTNVGPSADWITHPDEHDPFAPFGPNAVGPMLIVLGSLTTLTGVVLIVISTRIRKSAKHSQTP